MSDREEAFSTDDLLRSGLRELPVPETSADFAARIHAALEQPVSWRRTVLADLRLAFSGALCALVVVFALLPWVTQFVTAPLPIAPHSAMLTRHREGAQRLDLYAVSLWGRRAAFDRGKG